MKLPKVVEGKDIIKILVKHGYELKEEKTVMFLFQKTK